MTDSVLKKIKKNEEPIFIHFHNGKSGGSTLGQIFSRNIDNSKFFSPETKEHNGFGIWKVDDIKEIWQSLDEKTRANVRWSGGHVPFGMHEVFERPSLYFGLIREPASRWISSLFYNYQRTGRDIEKEGVVVSDVASNIRTTVFANPQTRYFSGADPQDIINENHLIKAKDNISKHFVFVAPTERFDEAVVLGTYYLNWKLLSSVYTKENVTPPHPLRKKIDKKTIALIEDVHSLDMKLYQFCLERFENEIKLLGIRFEIKRKIFSLLCSIKQKSIK